MGPSPITLGNVLSPARKDVHKQITPFPDRFVNPFSMLLLYAAHEGFWHDRSRKPPPLPDAITSAAGANDAAYGKEMATPFQPSVRCR